MTLTESLARLEQLAAALDHTDRAELDRIEQLLAERAAAVKDLQVLIADQKEPLPPAYAERLETVLDSGLRLREKLLLSKASIRDELGRLFQTGFLLRALAPQGMREPTQINCRG